MISRLAFPDSQHLEASMPKRSRNLSVAVFVACEFVRPILKVAFRMLSKAAVLVLVPEAAMNHEDSTIGQDNVGLTRKVAPRWQDGLSKRFQNFQDAELGLRSAAFDSPKPRTVVFSW